MYTSLHLRKPKYCFPDIHFKISVFIFCRQFQWKSTEIRNLGLSRVLIQTGVPQKNSTSILLLLLVPNSFQKFRNRELGKD